MSQVVVVVVAVVPFRSTPAGSSRLREQARKREAKWMNKVYGTQNRTDQTSKTFQIGMAFSHLCTSKYVQTQFEVYRSRND